LLSPEPLAGCTPGIVTSAKTGELNMQASNLERRRTRFARLQPALSIVLVTAVFVGAVGTVWLAKARAALPTPPSSAVAATPTNEVRLGFDPVTAEETNREVETMTITVLDAETGKPLPQIELQAPNLGWWNQREPKRLTDQAGRFVLRVPIPPADAKSRISMFSISATHADYAPRSAAWTSSGGDVYATLPKEVTIKLERGIQIGGTVHDSHAKALQGVRVLLSGSGYAGFTMGTAEQKTHDYPQVWLMDKAAPAATTDSSGNWTFNHFPSDLKTLDVTLIRPDESKTTFSTAPSYNNINHFPLVALGDLQARKAQFILPDGITVRGIVVDEFGKPIAGALVKEAYGHGNLERVSELKTEPDGRFSRFNRVPRQWIYTASADGRATVSIVAQVEAGMAELRLVLPPAKALLLRVLDQAGQPVPDASVTLEAYRNEAQILDWTGTASPDGRIIWTNAPVQEIRFFVFSKTLGKGRQFKARADGQEKTLILPGQETSQARINIKCRDAQTREPVQIRSVSAEYNGAFSFKTIAEPATNECNVEVRSSDFKVGMGESYRLKIEAEDHEPAITDYIDLAEGDQALELALARAVKIEGMALLSEDAPAAGARIWIRSAMDAGALFCNSPGQYYGDRFVKVRVAADGRFELPPTAGDTAVVFTHTNGFLETTFSKLRSNPKVHLRPWGSVEGRLLVAGEPKIGVRVSLATLRWTPSLGFQLIYMTTSAADGTFAFTNVPAGEYKLYRDPLRRMGRPITEDHQMPLVVTPGAVTKIDYAQKGRAVVGQVVPDKPDLPVDWLNDDHVLVLKQPPAPILNREDFATFKAFQAAQNASYSSQAQLRQAREARAYVLMFERDGSFRADDIPPGTYELRIRVTKPNEQQRFGFFSRPEDELGSLTREVVVPGGEGTFYLGNLVVPMTGDAGGKRGEPLQFTAETLDTRPVNLDDFKGKHLLLVFWGSWSQRSLEQLSELKKLQAQFSQNSALALLGVSVDSDIESVKATVETNRYNWTQAWLTPEKRARVTAAFDVNTLPDIFLLDPAGRIIGRDLEGDRIRISLQRALAAK
jgi:protocatechuate 3,4-dioxygenase beta subunit/peroxiredoxin